MFEKDILAKSEIKALSPLLAEHKNTLPYLIPDENYLNIFSEQLTEKITISSHLDETNTPYSIPSDYFNLFSSRMLDLIRSNDVEQELIILSPLLSQVSRKLPYEPMPTDLEISEEKLAGIGSRKKQSKVISLISSKIIGYAVAASVLFAVLTFVIENITPNKNKNIVSIPATISEQQFNHLLASADEQEIIEYLKEEGIQLNQSEIETMVDPASLPDEINYFDQQFSDKFFEEIQTDINL
jgi:hypothetical protein